MEGLTTSEFVERFNASRDWGLLLGSAVSAGHPTDAPMASPTIKGLMLALGDELESRVPEMSRTYHRVVDTLPWDVLRRNIKFEVALSHLNSHAPGMAKALLQTVFSMKRANANHMAVGRLHETRWAKWVITTNFDGALEGTGCFRGWSIRLPFRDGDVIKLHGDGETGEGLVATMEAMTQSRAMNLVLGVFQSLSGLGMSKLLAVGYSGTGDVDVAPALEWARGSGLEIWWAAREGMPPPGIRLAGIVRTDLSSADPTMNVLAGLSGLEAPTAPCIPSECEAASAVKQLLSSTITGWLETEQLIRIPVSLLLGANLGWQAAGLLWASDRLIDSLDNREQWHLACERVSAYTVAARYLEDMPRANGVEHAARLSRIAFLLQEAGQTKQSRRLFGEAVQALGDAEATGEVADFVSSDLVRRGHFESELELCSERWGVEGRRRMIDRLGLARKCRKMQEAAWYESPAVAEVLRLRAAQIRFMISRERTEREGALIEAAHAMEEAIRLQHADGEAVASRFLLAGSSLGRRLRDKVRASFDRRTSAPSRDRLKAIPAYVQGYLPPALMPWKMQPPLMSLQKRILNSIAVFRLKMMKKIWRPL